MKMSLNKKQFFQACQRRMDRKPFSRLCALTALCAGFSSPAFAGPLEMAKQIHDRIAGVPPSEAVLLQMKNAIEADGVRGGEAAARIAMEDDNFYNATLKNWIAPWTNRDQNAHVDLNDYIATTIGVIRDDLDYRSVLYGDYLYIADPNLGLQNAYSVSSNAHYEELQRGGYSLKDSLVMRSQAQISGLPEEAVAGVVTSRAAAKAFFIAGTNRANFRFTLLNHLCMDLEQLQDNTRIPDRIRQDVSRSPGGDSRVFLNNCVSCHSGMDPMAQAFAYPETGTRVKAKYHINSTTFPFGYVTPDNRWDNYWREGQNKSLGWAPINGTDIRGYGNGAASMLKELSHSQAFAQCAVKKVFKTVCLREPEDQNDRNAVDTMVSSFNSDPKLKKSFAEAANYCKGE